MNRMSILDLEFKDMSFAYENGEQVFSGFSHKFSAGEVLFVQGPRGTGKNTLMKMLLGLIAPLEGQYLVNGIVVNEFSYAQFDPFRVNMGYGFDVGGLINNQTLYENFRLLLDYHAYLPPSDRFNYICERMELFDLDGQKHLRPALVSSSVRKAASVLRAFLLDPELIILDNPSLGMNAEQVPALIQLIKKHQMEKNLKFTLILSEDPKLIQGLGGKIVKVTSNGLLVNQKEIRAVG